MEVGINKHVAVAQIGCATEVNTVEIVDTSVVDAAVVVATVVVAAVVSAANAGDLAACSIVVIRPGIIPAFDVLELEVTL